MRNQNDTQIDTQSNGWLKNTAVKRGGATSSNWSGIYKNCHYKVCPDKETLDLSFFIPSKGGGETHIVVEISKEDISEIFNDVLSHMPTEIKLLSTFDKDKIDTKPV